jgi:hypothetical protein
MACPNFKKGLKMAFGPLGIKGFYLKTTYVHQNEQLLILALKVFTI